MMVRFTKPVGSILMGLLAANGLIAALLAHQETKSFLNLQSKLNEIENKYELEHGS